VLAEIAHGAAENDRLGQVCARFMPVLARSRSSRPPGPAKVEVRNARLCVRAREKFRRRSVTRGTFCTP